MLHRCDEITNYLLEEENICDGRRYGSKPPSLYFLFYLVPDFYKTLMKRYTFLSTNEPRYLKNHLLCLA